MAKNQQLASIDICHLASAHERNDTRIGLKMARSALDQGLSVAFVVADDGPEETRNGMLVVGVKRYRQRLLRMLFGPISVYRAALPLNARMYKLHDPELLLLMPFIKLFSRAKFVFDSHEDVPIQFLAKPYLTPILRRVGSSVLKVFEVVQISDRSSLFLPNSVSELVSMTETSAGAAKETEE